ncbi:RNA polymerase-associated protein Rtf1-like isoform X1 [Penaeus indicus]|uniref:RNA polymerase-associated protein Rtf1-like isoform X1 n=1 Tax=Penaeus indicus TaxID=29960 RepID=UPI00300D6ABB
MNKRKAKALIDSDSDDEGGSGTDIDSELLALAQKKKKKPHSDSESSAGSSPKQPAARPKVASDSDSETSDSDSDWDAPKGRKKKMGKAAGKTKNKRVLAHSDSDESRPAKGSGSEPEEGEVSDSNSSDSEVDLDEEFDDGLDENMIGDEEDRARLEQMTEKEREQEIYNRIEKREVLRTRFEIEKKLKLAKKKDQQKRKEKEGDKPKEKKQPVLTDRKKTLEERAGKTDKFAALKAKRENKIRLAEEERLKKEKQEEEKRRKKEEKERSAESDSDAEDSKAKHKLKASEVYSDSDDSGSDSDKSTKSEKSTRRRSSSSSSSSSSGSDSDSGSLSGEESAKPSSFEAATKPPAKVTAKPTAKPPAKKPEPKVSGRLEQKILPSSSSSSSSSSSCSSPSSSSSSFSDSSDSDVSPKKNKVGRSNDSYRSRDERPKTVSSKEDLEKIRLSRHKMERFVHLPIFSKAIIGCYVRIGIGSNQGRPVYRVAEITEVCETAKIYQLGNTRTNKGLRLKHGSHERVFRLEFVSNSVFSDSEYNKWVEDCAAHGTPLPLMEHVTQKQKDIQDLLYYQFSSEDIDKMVEEKARFNNNPTNFAVAKTLLMKEKDMAQQKGDEDTVEKLNGQIADLDEKASSLDKRRTQTIASISYINERNRKNNVEKAERAIMAEIAAKKGMKVEDPFTRRSTRPTMVTKTKEPEVVSSEMLLRLEQERKVKQEEEKKKKEEEAAKRKQEDEKKKDDERKRVQAEDLFAAHDFDVKIDLDVSMPATAPLAPKATIGNATNGSSIGTAPKRSLNLEEYKKKKGLI